MVELRYHKHSLVSLSPLGIVIIVDRMEPLRMPHLNCVEQCQACTQFYVCETAQGGIEVKSRGGHGVGVNVYRVGPLWPRGILIRCMQCVYSTPASRSLLPGFLPAWTLDQTPHPLLRLEGRCTRWPWSETPHVCAMRTPNSNPERWW